MTTNEKGNIGLAKVINSLVTNEFSIYLPFSDTSPIDLIVANKKLETKKLQIKYIKAIKNIVTIRFSSVVNGKRILVDPTGVDFWAVYCPDNDRVFYIPSVLVKGKKNFSFRIDEDYGRLTEW
jgi:PD-(D/E)XK nuclease superfamily protein